MYITRIIVPPYKVGSLQENMIDNFVLNRQMTIYVPFYCAAIYFHKLFCFFIIRQMGLVSSFIKNLHALLTFLFHFFYNGHN